ncbi:MAG TPA: hypothetical protein VMV72_19575 [Verrucomicrobiae bacterium]|nr:hypothetical protein [Verrucomicrobiae bacterium]
MSNRTAILTFSVSVAFLIPAVLSFAQLAAPVTAPPFHIKQISQLAVAPPDYRAMFNGSGNTTVPASDRWLRIETVFDSTPDWADDVQLKYYVLLNDGQQTRLFVGDVTYVNVAKGLGHLSAMYMPPNTLQRYGNGHAQVVGVQLFYKGQLIDQGSTPPTPDRWWERYTTSVSGFLVTPQHTPWSLGAYSRYEQVKPSAVTTR